jgi:hypothetical protein
MNKLAYYLLLGGSFLPLLLVISVYNAAGWNWKAKPIIPLVSGMAILALAFVANLWLTTTSAELKQFIDNPPTSATKEALSVFAATAQSDDGLAKLIELVTIPLAVSLIAAALFGKADLEFEATKKRYQRNCERLSQLESELDAAAQRFEASLEAGVRGQSLLTEWHALRARRNEMIFARNELLEEFQPLIDASIVDPPLRKSASHRITP